MDSAIRGISLYLVMLVIIRLSGRRTMDQATPFDFVLLLIVTLFLMDIGLSYLANSSAFLSKPQRQPSTRRNGDILPYRHLE